MLYLWILPMWGSILYLRALVSGASIEVLYYHRVNKRGGRFKSRASSVLYCADNAVQYHVAPCRFVLYPKFLIVYIIMCRYVWFPIALYRVVRVAGFV